MMRRLLLLSVCLLGALLVRAQEGYRLVGQRFGVGSGAVVVPSTTLSVAWQAGGLEGPEMRDAEGALSFAGVPLLALPTLLDPGVNPAPVPTPEPSSVERSLAASLSISPNPSSGAVRISWLHGAFEPGSRLDLHSVAGVRVLSVPTEGAASCLVDVGALPGGVYMLRLVSSAGRAQGLGRLLVVR